MDIPNSESDSFFLEASPARLSSKPYPDSPSQILNSNSKRNRNQNQNNNNDLVDSMYPFYNSSGGFEFNGLASPSHVSHHQQQHHQHQQQHHNNNSNQHHQNGRGITTSTNVSPINLNGNNDHFNSDFTISPFKSYQTSPTNMNLNTINIVIHGNSNQNNQGNQNNIHIGSSLNQHAHLELDQIYNANHQQIIQDHGLNGHLLEHQQHLQSLSLPLTTTTTNTNIIQDQNQDIFNNLNNNNQINNNEISTNENNQINNQITNQQNNQINYNNNTRNENNTVINILNHPIDLSKLVSTRSPSTSSTTSPRQNYDEMGNLLSNNNDQDSLTLLNEKLNVNAQQASLYKLARLWVQNDISLSPESVLLNMQEESSSITLPPPLPITDQEELDFKPVKRAVCTDQEFDEIIKQQNKDNIYSHESLIQQHVSFFNQVKKSFTHNFKKRRSRYQNSINILHSMMNSPS